jgi:hypothetical protein
MCNTWLLCVLFFFLYTIYSRMHSGRIGMSVGIREIRGPNNDGNIHPVCKRAHAQPGHRHVQVSIKLGLPAPTLELSCHNAVGMLDQ